ncbi:MAG TPA: chloride channel protein [Acidobacteriaceae bacterium]|jgi:CIC family chloride channel protein|nr:chloride channel protein [Acidobacteriaceae bacterium]
MNKKDASATKKINRVMRHPLLRKYFPRVHEDLIATYSRDLHKWLLIAPIIGVTTGLTITGIAVIILGKLWPVVLGYYLRHHWAIVPGLMLAFTVTGLIMQFLTPDPDEHSTEEIIRSYHEHQGDIDMRPFFPKLLAAITTVGFGGSAALEGPSIYGGAAIGSWLWTKLRRLRLDSRDRRIMLICGAAAGMSAVFRAPLTGIVFALEMPYKDDLAHEALVPSLIASVISYVTLRAFLGGAPLFDFASTTSFTGRDLYWCAFLGLIIGLIAMAFVITFRRARSFFVKWSRPHWQKLAIGGLLTGICGLLFLHFYPGTLVPLGPNYEAVGAILGTYHSSLELVVFSAFKLAATLFTLAVGGVSAMFVPLFLTGGALGAAFAQSIVHSSSLELYAAVGMASFIAAGYKTPLAAVVFVAEATGGHAFIIPTLIGAAVAYAVSGDASASAGQRLHEGIKIQELRNITVDEIMQPQMISVPASLSLREFTETLAPHYRHTAFPVFEERKLLGTITLWELAQISPDKWETTKVRDITDRRVLKVASDCDVMEALGLLLNEYGQPLLVITEDDQLKGIVTKTDILQVLKTRRNLAQKAGHATVSEACTLAK